MRDDVATDLHSTAGPLSVESEHDEPPAEARREGLPKTYRSRHDAHYVEQIIGDGPNQPVRMLPIERIDAPDVDAEELLADLAKSITELGVLQPLLVRPHDGRFSLITGRHRLAAARRAGLTDVPCLVHAVSEEGAKRLEHADNLRVTEPPPLPDGRGSNRTIDDLDLRTEALVDQLQDVIANLQAALTLLPRMPASTRERLGVRLISSEVERAAWLVRARRHLASEPPVAHATIAGPVLLDHVKRVAASMMALRGGTLRVDIAQLAHPLNGDRELLSDAVIGLVWTLFALGETVGDLQVHLRLAAQMHDGPPVLTVTQKSAVLSESAVARFLDSGVEGRAGGAASELAVSLARYAAARHGASLEVSSVAGTGTVVRLAFAN